MTNFPARLSWVVFENFFKSRNKFSKNEPRELFLSLLKLKISKLETNMKITAKQILLVLPASILLHSIPASADQDCPIPKNIEVKQTPISEVEAQKLLRETTSENHEKSSLSNVIKQKPISEIEAQKLFQENDDERYSVSKTVLVKQTPISEIEAQKLFGQATTPQDRPAPNEH